MADKEDPKTKRSKGRRGLLKRLISKWGIPRTQVHGSATTQTSPGSQKELNRTIGQQTGMLGRSAQVSILKRTKEKLKVLKRRLGIAASNKGKKTGKVLQGEFGKDKRQVAASKQFSTDFEGRVYSILSEKITHTMTSLEIQKAKRKMERGQKFRQSHAQKAATEKSGFVQSGGADIGT